MPSIAIAQPDYRQRLAAATTVGDIYHLFKDFFGIAVPSDPNEYKNENSDYGLKVRGVKAREKINAQCKEILARVSDPSQLTPEEREILLQYSGRGGLTENSQWEYYTPTPVAQGIWGAMKANGFENGNVLEPSCGAGVFLGTKPAGVIMSANDLDPTSSGVASLLNPGDKVSNSPFEEVVVSTADDTFDSCVGNVPFGRARGASMALDPAYKNEKQVERYFILRILDKIKPGGLACLVVPTGVVGDKGAKWKEFRVAVSKKAEFLGAHKLPSSTFGGKGGQGTDTVTDVIVLRKHGRSLLDKLRDDEIPAETLREANVYWDEFISGKYWQGEGRPFIMGRYVPKDTKDRFSREKVEGNIDSITLKRNLAHKFHSRIKWDILNDVEPILRNYVDGDRRYINGDPYVYKNGTWDKVEITQSDNKLDKAAFGADTVKELEAMLKELPGALDITCKQAFMVLSAYPNLMTQQQRDAVQLAMAQPSEDVREQIYRGSIIGSLIAKMGVDEQAGEDVSARRRVLQNIVVTEIQKYGHPANNPKLALAGDSSRAFGVFMNCMDKNGQFSDLMAGTLDKSRAKGYQEDNLRDIVSYLYNQNGDHVEFDDVKALYNGSIKLNDLGDLAQIDEIAITPDGMIMTTAKYCSGDVVSKMAQLQEAIGKTDDERLRNKFQKQISMMNAKIKRVPLDDITFGLQHKWFSRQYILDFLRENGYPNAAFGKWGEEEYEAYDGTITTRTTFVQDVNLEDGEFLLHGPNGSKPVKFALQLQKFLNGQNISGGTQEIISENKIAAQQIQDSFDSWMKQHPDCDELAEKYSLAFNGFIQPEYETSPLDIDDIISGEITPHTYQNAEVRRLSEQGAGICGFGTGLGKSFTALAMAAYNYKHGRARRTCIVVPSAVLENWYHEARTFYSESYMRSNVLVVGLEPKLDEDGNIERRPILDENGSPKLGKNGQPIMQDVVRFAKGKQEIYEAMWKIPQSNFSLVVMTKEKFQSIPIRPDTMKIFMDSMVKKQLLSDKDAGIFTEKKKTSYADDVKKNSSEGKFINDGGKKKDELPFLEDMGFDSIITDESHFFKNSLSKGEKMGGVAGISSPDPSGIAIDMSIKCDWLRRKNNGRGVYGLTATPVTNSPIEIFNMLSLVCPIEEFEKMGIYTVDDFIRVFGKVEERERLTSALEAEMKDTLVGFQNLDGLRNLFLKYVNIKTVEDVDDEIHVPNAEIIEEEVELTDEQAAIYKKLKDEAQVSSKAGFNKDKDTRSIFSIMRDMDRLSTDYDLYKRRMIFIFSGVHKKAMEKLLPTLPTTFTVDERNEETGKKEKVTYNFEPKIVDNGDTISLIVHDQHEDAVLKAMSAAKISEEEVTHPLSPKYAKLISNLKIHLDANGKQIVFIEEKSQHHKLKRLLMHHLAIKEALIGIINADDAKGDKLDKISKAYNAGEIKIVIANKKAEVGVNLQKGTTAIHHLTLPWTPASINQRNGRGVRQGNKVDTVKIYYYQGKGTFDAYRKQVLDNKSNWIGQLLTGKESRAENADIAADEEMAAMISGNIEEYRRAKAEREVRRKNAANTNLVNRLKILQSLMNNLQTLEERRKEAKQSISLEIEEQKQRITRYKEQNKGEETIKKSMEKLDKLQTKAATLDKKFDAEKVKAESQRNQIVGMLRQVAKKGELPFDEALIDNPQDCLITLKGELYSVGNCLEIHDTVRVKFYPQRFDGVFLVFEIDTGNKTISFEDVTGSSGRHWNISAELLEGKATKVSYSASELAIKRLQSGAMSYCDLPGSGLTKEQFLENLDILTLHVGDGAVMSDASGKYYLVNSKHNIQEDMRFVWPEPNDENFRKNVLSLWLNEQRTVSYNYYDELCRKLFGADYAEQALAYGHNATQTEMNQIISKTWDDLREKYTSGHFLAKINLGYGNGDFSSNFSKRATQMFQDAQFDNSGTFNELVKQFIAEKLREIKQLALEMENERNNIEQQKLSGNSNIRKVPQDIQERLKAYGMTAYYNTLDTFLLWKRKTQSFAAFSRLFIHDENAKAGRLFAVKEALKARWKAQYTTEWKERSGSWWHIPSDVNLEELCDTLGV